MTKYSFLANHDFTNNNKIFFLLGGKDLEMITIKNILIKNKVNFYDANLTWDNAFLSTYLDYIYEDNVYYGVELIEDCPLPKNYIRIDHHNNYSYKISSLEQIASLLNIQLDRWQKLVAINDAQYIDGMTAFGATVEEINLIRLKDRKAQGVSKFEEIEAINAIEKSKMTNGVRLVYTTNNHFSPICDRLFPFHNLLIYNKEKLVYYGAHINKVIEEYTELIHDKKAYYGGKNNKFFGLANGYFSEHDIKHTVENIIELVR